MSRRAISFLEGLVIVAILLVLVQSFLDDLSVLLDWSWDTRLTLLYAAFVLDLFFCIEFFCRFYFARVEGRARRYMTRGLGWVDLIASVPLLLFSSGPLVLAGLTGGAVIGGTTRMLNLLKVVKAIRIARVLRLLRTLKLFKRIRKVDAAMAQRHVTRAATTAASVVILVAVGFTAVDVAVGIPGLETDQERRLAGIAPYVDARGLTEESAQAELELFAEQEPLLLVAREDGEPRYSRYTDEEYRELFGPHDYIYAETAGTEVFLDLRPLHRAGARIGMLFFFAVLFIVVGYLVLYAPHFAVTVSDPIHVMRRGMEEDSYNLAVHIDPRFRSDEVFRLADSYNRVFLPLKDRNRGEGASSDLSVDDIAGIFDTGAEGGSPGESGNREE